MRVFFACEDGDFELVTAGGTIFALFVTSLDDELNWLVDGAILEQTRAVTERFLGFSVQEECESGIGRREVIAAKRELDDSVITSFSLVGSDGCQRCLIHESTLRKCGTFGSSTDCGFSAGCEVDRAVLLSEADTSDRDGYTTGDLAERWVNACNGIAGTDDL